MSFSRRAASASSDASVPAASSVDDEYVVGTGPADELDELEDDVAPSAAPLAAYASAFAASATCLRCASQRSWACAYCASHTSR